MGSIELKMAILTGAVGGLIMVLAEGVALHSKLSRYRAHLRELYKAKRLVRLFAEISSIAVVVVIQPVIVTKLVFTALDNFNPQFSIHAMAQLKHGITNDDLKEDRPLRGQ
ncbi:MAG TPA: hypothetical protein VMJ33_05600 [Gallionella sp.]|nr:hypothetical protein [Gallionella sp.]